jgi:signal peptidase I
VLFIGIICVPQFDMSSRLGQEIGRVAVLFSSLYVIQEYGVAVSMTVGPSMMPTFNPHGDIVIVNRSKQARSLLSTPFLHLTLPLNVCSCFLITKLAMSSLHLIPTIPVQ